MAGATNFEFRLFCVVCIIVVTGNAYTFNYSRDDDVERGGIWGCYNRSSDILLSIFVDLPCIASAEVSNLFVSYKTFWLMSFG